MQSKICAYSNLTESVCVPEIQLCLAGQNVSMHNVIMTQQNYISDLSTMKLRAEVVRMHKVNTNRG